MHVSMKTRKRNASVAITANEDTMEVGNTEGAEGSPNVSYAAVVDPPRRSFSNLAFSYDRFCNILSSSFRVFGTSSLWPSKEPSFLQRLFTVPFLV